MFVRFRNEGRIIEIFFIEKLGMRAVSLKFVCLNVDKYFRLKKVEKNNKNDAERIIEICKNQYAEAQNCISELAVYCAKGF